MAELSRQSYRELAKSALDGVVPREGRQEQFAGDLAVAVVYALFDVADALREVKEAVRDGS
jgi:hypothetical protein